MASCLASSSWKRWTWMARTRILCSFFSRRSFLSQATTPQPWWPTPSSSSGVLCAGTTSHGTLRSSSSALTESRSSATVGTSWPATSRLTSKSSSRKCSKPSWQDGLTGGCEQIEVWPGHSCLISRLPAKKDGSLNSAGCADMVRVRLFSRRFTVWRHRLKSILRVVADVNVNAYYQQP